MVENTKIIEMAQLLVEYGISGRDYLDDIRRDLRRIADAFERIADSVGGPKPADKQDTDP